MDIHAYSNVLIKNCNGAWKQIACQCKFGEYTSKCRTRVGRRVMLKWWTWLKLDWWNNVWRFCNPQPCPREYSLALHQKAKTHHDSVTVKYCSPALSGRLHSEQRGILRKLSKHLTEVAADTGTQWAFWLSPIFCCVTVNRRLVESRLLAMSGNKSSTSGHHILTRSILEVIFGFGITDFCAHTGSSVGKL